MTLSDHNLAELMKQLAPSECRAIEEALRGNRSATAAAVLRWIRMRLKRKARANKR